MTFDWPEFLSIAVIHFLAVASPGPDFAVVLKQSIQKGRTAAIYTSIGVGTGILLHVSYSLLGLSILISTTPWLYDLLLYLAAAYLCWIGFMALRSKQIENREVDEGTIKNQCAITKVEMVKCFTVGFLTNGLNPKASLFFLSVFTVVISAQTSFESKVVYGLYMALATGLWFSFLSVIISNSKIKRIYISNAYLLDKVMGAVLILMAIMLVSA